MNNDIPLVNSPYGQVTPRADGGVGMAVATAREAQEVQAMVFMAKQFPRDEKAAMQRILMACTRENLAEHAVYQYARGGSDVSGASIRLAEAIAQAWGNIDHGFVVQDATEKESSVCAYCWDIETNTRTRRTFKVSHIRHTRNGDKLLTDPRDIYEMVANQAARRVRACILATIPSDVIEAAVEQCKKTQEAAFKNGGESVADRVAQMVKMFAELGVTKKMLEAYIGRSLDGISPALLVKLRGVYKSIRDGIASVEDHFDAAMDRVAEKEQKRNKRASASEVLAPTPASVETAPEVEAEKVTADSAIPSMG